jgi:hypothetical protein
LTEHLKPVRFPPVARTIVIGDVHGCAFELSELLDKVAVAESDRVVFVGDLVARGPSSREVLGIVRSLGARAVRGNHEQRLLKARAAQKSGGKPPKLGASHAELLQSLDEREWAELEALPLKLDLDAHELRVVHAGVVPGRAWDEQDPWMVLHIRSMTEDGLPSERWGRPWGELYEGPPHVVFGHNAQKEPQLHPHATGLDTGCVYGGALTALVLEDNSPVPPVTERLSTLVRIAARRAYSDYGRALPGG